jgi:hypothetical protein
MDNYIDFVLDGTDFPMRPKAFYSLIKDNTKNKYHFQTYMDYIIYKFSNKLSSEQWSRVLLCPTIGNDETIFNIVYSSVITNHMNLNNNKFDDYGKDVS